MSTSGAVYTSASLEAANAPSFSTLKGKLDPQLLRALNEMNFDFMTPVQEKVMGGMPSLSSDCLVQAKTGTGKTTAFLLPAIQSTLTGSPCKGQVSILILSPTRELALQIAAEATRLVAKLRRPLEVHTAFGGTAKASTLEKFKKGDPKILVATPGRLEDYLSELDVRRRFEGMKTLILDEADRMLDAGFLPQILKVLRALPPKHGPNGSSWQGMCFSATIPPKMQEVFAHVLKKDHISISTIDASEPPTLAKVPQFSVVIPSVKDTFNAVFSLLREEINATEGQPKIIGFGTTANLVALYAKVFKNQFKLPVYELHSRLSQPARTKTTDSFKVAERGILFASDVVGRGMDFPDVSLVLQVGLPADADAYTHRVGRTARAGKDGRAIVLLTQAESFFLHANRHFPIKPYPASDKILNDLRSAPSIAEALCSIDADSKRKAYSAYLGFMKTFCNKMRMDTTQLVQMANFFALEGMLCAEIPPMEKSTIGKMGLKGVAGIRYADRSDQPPPRQKRGAPPVDNHTSNDMPSRRLRHQGVPEPMSNGVGHQSRGGHSNREGPSLGRVGFGVSRGSFRGASGARGGRGAFRGGKAPHSGDMVKQRRIEEQRNSAF